MLVGIFLTLVGVFMVIKPGLVWEICESWKSDWCRDPSSLYIWVTRIGGAICLTLGVLSIIVSFFAL